jgi:excinuclease UvrABC ATPase subunit
MRQLDEDIELDNDVITRSEVVVDRLADEERRQGSSDRIRENRTASDRRSGPDLDRRRRKRSFYSERMACINCGINIASLEPRSFSFKLRYTARANRLSGPWHGDGDRREQDRAGSILRKPGR